MPSAGRKQARLYRASHSSRGNSSWLTRRGLSAWRGSRPRSHGFTGQGRGAHDLRGPRGDILAGANRKAGGRGGARAGAGGRGLRRARRLQADHVLLQVLTRAGGLDGQQMPRRNLRLGIRELLGLLRCRSAGCRAKLRRQRHTRLRQGDIRRLKTLTIGPRRDAARPGSLGLAGLRPRRASRERRHRSRAWSYSPTYGRRRLELPNAKTVRRGRSGQAHFLRRG